MATIVNFPLYDAFDLLDNASPPNPITGKATIDFTSKAYLIKTPATTAPVTITELDAVNLSGKYGVSFTPTAVGAWSAGIVYNSGGVYRQFSGGYDVVTAQQADPAATVLATWTTVRAAKLDLIGSGNVIVTSGTAVNGDITIYQGDDYRAADNRALTWSSTAWPTLTGATITATFRDLLKNLVLTKTGTVVSATSCRVDLTRTDTATFASVGSYRFQVVAALSGSGDVVTLVDGTCTVLSGGGQ